MKARKIIGTLFVFAAASSLLTEQGMTIEGITASIILFVIGFVILIKKPKGNQNKYEAMAVKRINAVHQAGLPLATGVPCTITPKGNGFTFEGGGNKFQLDNEKITDVDIKVDTEIYQQYVSSIGAAAAGAVLFGPLGAIVGGRAKKKEDKKSTEYLIFTYLKEGKVDYISFELAENTSLAFEWVNKFKSTTKSKQNEAIDL